MNQAWPPYEVLCVGLDSAERRDGHRHIALAETRDPDGGQTRWAERELLAAIQTGDRFLVATDDQGHETRLDAGSCTRCGATTVTVEPPGAHVTQCG